MLTSFLVDGRLAVDAGSLGLEPELETLRNVSDVLVTHSHLDHVATLPIFIERVYGQWRQTTRVSGHPHAIDSLRRDVFNDRIYPNLLGMADAQPPFLEVEPLQEGVERSILDYTVTPVAVEHTVPCYGYLISSGGSTTVFAGDSRPTDEIWTRCHDLQDGPLLVFAECSFPNRMEDFALRTGHLTPRLLEREMEKLPDRARVVAVHIKADYFAEVTREIQTIADGRIELGDAQTEYAV